MCRNRPGRRGRFCQHAATSVCEPNSLDRGNRRQALLQQGQRDLVAELLLIWPEAIVDERLRHRSHHQGLRNGLREHSVRPLARSRPANNRDSRSKAFRPSRRSPIPPTTGRLSQKPCTNANTTIPTRGAATLASTSHKNAVNFTTRPRCTPPKRDAARPHAHLMVAPPARPRKMIRLRS